jgi:hypothetical protein
MIYRQLDSNHDYQLNKFLKDSPETVGQAVKTRLLLWLGEWSFDTSDGTPYLEDIFGVNTNYDLEIQNRILGTDNVLEILDYSSKIDTNRNLTVTTRLNTTFGVTTIST